LNLVRYTHFLWHMDKKQGQLIAVLVC
jgi:hypothetical protein